MKTREYIDYNNELRAQLSKENRMKYEELLIQIRILGVFRKEKYIEDITLQLLQDLIDYQKEGKDFEEVYGNDTFTIAKSIIKEIDKESKESVIKNILMTVLLYISICMLLSYDNNFNLINIFMMSVYAVAMSVIFFLRIINKVKTALSMFIIICILNCILVFSLYFINKKEIYFNIFIPNYVYIILFLIFLSISGFSIMRYGMNFISILVFSEVFVAFILKMLQIFYQIDHIIYLIISIFVFILIIIFVNIYSNKEYKKRKK